jgi:hypothetical protein
MSSSDPLDGDNPAPPNGGNARVDAKTIDVDRKKRANTEVTDQDQEHHHHQQGIIDPTFLGISAVAHIQPNNLIVAPDGAVYAMIKPPDNYQGGPIPHHQNLKFGHHNVASSHLTNSMMPGTTTSLSTSGSTACGPSSAFTAGGMHTGAMPPTMMAYHPSTAAGVTNAGPFVAAEEAIASGNFYPGATAAIPVDGSGLLKRGDCNLGKDNLHITHNDNPKRIKGSDSFSSKHPQEKSRQPSEHLISADATTTSTAAASDIASTAPVTGRSYLLSTESDERNLSQYQCMARKQIEIFEATPQDAKMNAQGRNRPVLVGQVGIRCKHCANVATSAASAATASTTATSPTSTKNKKGLLPTRQRQKTGSVYFPNRVSRT